MRGHFKKLGDFRMLKEFKVLADGEYAVGDKIGLEIFNEGDLAIADCVVSNHAASFAGGAP